MYSVVFSPTAKRQYLNLEKEMQRRVSLALRRLVFSPEKHVEKLVGFDAYKFRVGDYRAILDIQRANLVITVLKIGHWKNIYKEI